MRPYCILFVLAFALQASADDVDFNRDVRPVLSRNCFACHGPNEESREADLRLDTADGAMADLGGYRAIKPGNPDASKLVQRIESDDAEVVMPPPKSGHELSPEEKRVLRRWIADGGDYVTHWSFKPPTKTPLPPVGQSDWPRHAIDHFVLEKLEAAGLSPSEEADRYRLLRRLSLDLTGLPPTPDEADAFAADTNEIAMNTVVDRLLESDAYGEHWARMWLDLARYADTRGYEKDRPREMWRYRDWVIEALNRDLPFDQFTTEQLAGDLLTQPTSDQLLATAFHRNTMTNDEGGTDNEEYRVAAVKDRVDTTIQVWMGLTMGCAKCHSHKYDPISLEDYYAFYALFNQTEDADRGDESPTTPMPTSEQKRQTHELESAIKELDAQLTVEPEGFAEAYEKWTSESGPLWTTLEMSAFESKHDVELAPNADGTLIASGDRPDKDVWKLTLDLPESGQLTSLRIDVLPKSVAGGEWDDRNVAVRELTVEYVQGDNEPQTLKLTNARADFSQQNWDVSKAIDGDPKLGWAIAPKTDQPRVALFDFEKPIDANTGAKLRLTFDQEHGGKLTLARFRVSTSSLAPKYLTADININVEKSLRAAYSRHDFPTTKELHRQRDQKRKSLDDLRAAIPKTPIMRELASDKRRETRIHRRGNFLDQGDTIESHVLELFGELPGDSPLNRLGVAQWIMQPENPMTSRVMVNRVWARLFGTGIVETEEDFGSQGMVPTHPELLDWLAVDFRDSGWSLKHLIRTIVLSSTYRQSAVTSEKILAADPRNRLFARGPRFRLPAETVRDQALAVSGLLTTKVGGPSVMPPQPSGVWKTTYSNLSWQDAKGPDRYRRALYTYWKRTSPYPAMMTFDAGSGEVCQVRRVRTNTPLQALVTLNDPAFVEAAGALAQRMAAVEGDVGEKIAWGFRLVLTRPPDPQETASLIRLYENMHSDFATEESAANQLVKAAGLDRGDPSLIAVANVLLNLDETLMKP